MGGGLQQLVAYGAQDVYITGNPQITFFKVVYRRHTNFAVESIQQNFHQEADFGRSVSTTISRNGDLIHRVLLEITLPDIHVTAATAYNTTTPPLIGLAGSGTMEWTRWVNYLGHAIIKYAEVEIGGQKIDKHYGEWLHIWNQLTMDAGHESGYHRMIGNLPELILPRVGRSVKSGGVRNDSLGSGVIPTKVLQIPLQFWFCRNPGLALPLIALQYHEVKIHIHFRELKKCLLNYTCNQLPGSGTCCKAACDILKLNTAFDNTKLTSATLWVDYIFLDTDERRRFAQLSHEYLIEQVQHTDSYINAGNCSTKILLPFNHPVKELVWVAQKNDVKDLCQHFNYTTGVSPFFYGGNNDANRFIGEAVAERLIVGIDSYSGKAWNGQDTLNDGGSWETNFSMPFDSDLGGGVHHKDAAWNDPFVISMDHSYTPENLCCSAQLKFNGQDRIGSRKGDYFNYTQPYYHHTRTPATGINVYSFALRPEEHQPSGSCNFSRIDNAYLCLNVSSNAFKNHNYKIVNGAFIKDACGPAVSAPPAASPVKVSIYAVNYNVLRIMSGLGGLAYSN